MANIEFEQIVDDFEFLEDWEDKYRYVIEEGKKMPALDEALKVESNLTLNKGLAFIGSNFATSQRNYLSLEQYIHL